MQKIFFLVLIFFCPSLMVGQEIIVQGKVIDSERHAPLPNVSIIQLGDTTDYSTRTNTDGSFRIPLKKQKNIQLLFKKGGYADKIVSVPIRKKDMDQGYVALEVGMNAGELLPDVVITAPGMPVEIYSNTKHNLADFEFVDDQYLLLTYDKNPKKQRHLILADNNLKRITSIAIPKEDGKIIGFERSFNHEIILNTENQLFQITTGDNLSLTPIDRKKYDENIKPIIDTLNNKVYLSNWYDKYPAFAYYEYAIVDSSYQLLREIADDFMLELCHAEYKYLSGRSKLQYYRMELELGIDKEILACIDNFDQGLYYDPIYAPMFIVRDTILIFDQCDGLLCRYTLGREAIDSLKISYHQPGKKINKTYCEVLLQDEVKGNIYAQYQHQGGAAFLKKIDLNTGKIITTHALHHPYPENIKVKDGYAYYIYRPFESSQKKYLYREELLE